MTVIPPGSVIVSPRDMYDEIRGLRDDVGRLTSVVDPALTDIKAKQTDHEGRLRSLERKVWVAAGIAAAAGLGLSQAIQSFGG